MATFKHYWKKINEKFIVIFQTLKVDRVQFACESSWAQRQIKPFANIREIFF